LYTFRYFLQQYAMPYRIKVAGQININYCGHISTASFPPCRR
jgi:hypothetical protein